LPISWYKVVWYFSRSNFGVLGVLLTTCQAAIKNVHHK
jgi:hypothetical protein